jgi:pyruvate dehydrogenase E2 component (dihydrolipoamide acetyltransferase)
VSDFRMPSLGADMDEGTLVEWMVSVGDTVHRGDVIAVVDTAKSAIEIEVFQDGVVDELLVQPGATLPVGAPLARLRPTGTTERDKQPVTSPIVRHLAHERRVDLSALHGSGPHGEVTRADVEQATAKPPSVAAAAPPPATPTAPAPGDAGRLRASPYARRRAAELGIDLATVAGSGPNGVITVSDLEQPRTAPTAKEKQAAMRVAIGELMARSKREIPHYYLSTTIDLAKAMEWVRGVNAERGVEGRIVPAALLLKAVALAVKKVPDVNGFYRDGAFERSEAIHLGIAVSLRGGGLIAPALHDADTSSVDVLMQGLKDLVARARAGRLRGSEMSDPTITVTNLGEQGVESVVGVIYPPQVALVGFGRIVERPWAVDGTLAVHPLVTATLAADHRVTDGHLGGLFLAAVDDLLQRPEEL